MMKVLVNGEEVTLEEHCTVEELLKQCGLVSQPCAVEVNTQLVPKREHSNHILNDGDAIEIVTLVGGG